MRVMSATNSYAKLTNESAIRKTGYTLLYSGNNLIPKAKETIFLFQDNQLTTIYITILTAEGDLVFGALKQKLQAKYGEFEHESDGGYATTNNGMTVFLARENAATISLGASHDLLLKQDTEKTLNIIRNGMPDF